MITIHWITCITLSESSTSIGIPAITIKISFHFHFNFCLVWVCWYTAHKFRVISTIGQQQLQEYQDKHPTPMTLSPWPQHITWYNFLCTLKQRSTHQQFTIESIDIHNAASSNIPAKIIENKVVNIDINVNSVNLFNAFHINVSCIITFIIFRLLVDILNNINLRVNNIDVMIPISKSPHAADPCNHNGYNILYLS